MKENADAFYNGRINNSQQSDLKAERESSITGRDVWEILNEKSDKFSEREYLRQDKEKSEREAKEESDKQAKAMGLYVGLTGRCPHCTSMIR